MVEVGKLKELLNHPLVKDDIPVNIYALGDIKKGFGELTMVGINFATDGETVKEAFLVISNAK